VTEPPRGGDPVERRGVLDGTGDAGRARGIGEQRIQRGG
jgi:hypothetical protein